MEKQTEASDNKLPEEIPESPFWKITKKIFLFLIGLFMIYLMFSYLGLGPYLLNIIEGQLTSNELEANYTLQLENQTTIQFTENLYEQLFHLYITSQEHEFVACLSGIRSVSNTGQKTYFLQSLMVPKIYGQTFNSVVSQGCNATALIFLHNHPYKHCLFSAQDIETHQSFAAKNPFGLSALMCEENRFTFYGY